MTPTMHSTPLSQLDTHVAEVVVLNNGWLRARVGAGVGALRARSALSSRLCGGTTPMLCECRRYSTMVG